MKLVDAKEEEEKNGMSQSEREYDKKIIVKKKHEEKNKCKTDCIIIFATIQSKISEKNEAIFFFSSHR